MLKSQDQSGLFRQLFQYSVICHYSKYIRLALPTDFNKNRVFYRICMRLLLNQIFKKITEGNARKPAFILHCKSDFHEYFFFYQNSVPCKRKHLHFELSAILQTLCGRYYGTGKPCLFRFFAWTSRGFKISRHTSAQLARGFKL